MEAESLPTANPTPPPVASAPPKPAKPKLTPEQRARRQRGEAIAFVKDVNRTTANAIRDLRTRIKKVGQATKAEGQAMRSLQVRATILCMVRAAIRNAGHPAGMKPRVHTHEFDAEAQNVIAAAVCGRIFRGGRVDHNPMFVDCTIVETVPEALRAIERMRGIQGLAQMLALRTAGGTPH